MMPGMDGGELLRRIRRDPDTARAQGRHPDRRRHGRRDRRDADPRRRRAPLQAGGPGRAPRAAGHDAPAGIAPTAALDLETSPQGTNPHGPRRQGGDRHGRGLGHRGGDRPPLPRSGREGRRGRPRPRRPRGRRGARTGRPRAVVGDVAEESTAIAYADEARGRLRPDRRDGQQRGRRLRQADRRPLARGVGPRDERQRQVDLLVGPARHPGDEGPGRRPVPQHRLDLVGRRHARPGGLRAVEGGRRSR